MAIDKLAQLRVDVASVLGSARWSTEERRLLVAVLCVTDHCSISEASSALEAVAEDAGMATLRLEDDVSIRVRVADVAMEVRLARGEARRRFRVIEGGAS